MDNQLILWQPTQPRKIPPNASTPQEILPYANSHQLTSRDKTHLTSAFEHQHYEMVSSFIWTKALASLKAQLGKLGSAFISEMLDRPDIDGSLSVDQVLTDFEALRLAKELGVISGTGAMRLRHSLETLMHFGQLTNDEDDQMTSAEAISIVRACVENILGQEKIEAALDFKQFRDSLENRVFNEESSSMQLLLRSPYFFWRASVRILVALVKSRKGAQLENSLANANVIVPLLWSGLAAQEKIQLGRAYSDVTSEGNKSAAAGMRKMLLKVRGFDFVPEDLRSRSFIKAANALITAHEGANNFYNEPGPARHLDSMGSTIPGPAFPICMSAILSVKLGNRWNICYEAQKYVNAMLSRIPRDRWSYYLNECIKSDERVLLKLLEDKPLDRWLGVVKEYGLGGMTEDINDSGVRHLLSTAQNKKSRVEAAARKFVERLGYHA